MAHTHSISHTHSYKPSGTISSHTHTISHTHGGNTLQVTGSLSCSQVGFGAGFRDSDGIISCYGPWDRVPTGSHNYQGHYQSFKISTSGKWSGSTSEPSNSRSGSATPTFTGTQATIGSMNTSTSGGASNSTTSAPSTATSGKTGGNTAINIMPPYEVAYCWKRTK